MSIRVQVIDNLLLVQAGLRAVLASMPEIDLIDAFACGTQCAEGCVNQQPDVLILALSQGGSCNLECIHRIAIRHPKVNILVLTDVEDPIMASRALRAGAMGYLAKDSTPRRLSRAIRAVAGERVYIDPRVAQRLAAVHNSHGASPFDALSRREFEVFLLLAEGKIRPEIAEQLHLSPKTVSNHHAHIMKKLGVKSQTELARLAIRHGVVSA